MVDISTIHRGYKPTNTTQGHQLVRKRTTSPMDERVVILRPLGALGRWLSSHENS